MKLRWSKSSRLLQNIAFLVHINIIAYCQQNRYVRLAIYTDLLTLSNVTESLASEYNFLPFFQTAVELEKNGRNFPASVLFSWNAASL